MIAVLISGVLGIGVAIAPPPPAAAAAVVLQAAQVTPADAAPFIGDWTLEMQGGNGPATFLMSVKVEKEKVVGEISSEQMPKQPISDISLSGKTLVLSYSFTWEGNPVGAVVSLIPAAEGKTTAQIDFAGGAYVMAGTASKKESAK
jgi:hypothetical protein